MKYLVVRQLLDGAIEDRAVVAENGAQSLLGNHHISGLSEEAHVHGGRRVVRRGSRLDRVVAARCPTNSIVRKKCKINFRSLV